MQLTDTMTRIECYTAAHHKAMLGLLIKL